MSSKGTRRPRAGKDTEEAAAEPESAPSKRVKPSVNNIGLPSWKGSYICYCGVDADGKSTGEAISFPQFCLCTDVSGRASCAQCKENIAKGCARVGVQERRFNNSVFAKCKWYHPSCFASGVKGFLNVHQIEMWDTAGAEVRDMIIQQAPKGLDVEKNDPKLTAHKHSDSCLACREKGTHPSIEASKKKKGDADEEEDGAEEKAEDDEEEPVKKGRAKKDAKSEKAKPAEKKKGKKAAEPEPEDEEEEEEEEDGGDDDGDAEYDDGDTDMKAAEGGLPAWKGAFICYCGTTDSGHSEREVKVNFPQVCICTDVSGRASCKQCKKPIMKGTPRVGVQVGKFSHTGQGSCGWFHPGCFARNPPKKFEHINQIEQLDLAPDEIKKEIARNLPASATAPSKSAPGPRQHSDTCKQYRAQGAHRVTLARRENAKAAKKE